MHLFAVEQQLTLVGDVCTGQAFDQGGLAGPVVADDRQHLPCVKLKADPVQPDHSSECLHEALGLEYRNTGGGLGGLDRVFDEAHLRTFLIHWSTATATMTRMPIASVWYRPSTPARNS